MAHLCDDSPDSLDVRLGNPSSDDSLILDDNNTGGLWADSENEPATFQVHLKQHSSSFSERPDNAVDCHDGCFRKPWVGPKTAVMSGTTRNAYSILMQDRLSLSGEESEAPLLSSVSAFQCLTKVGFPPSQGHVANALMLLKAIL